MAMAFFSRKNTSAVTRERQMKKNKIHQLMQLSKYDRALLLLDGLLKDDTLPESELDILYKYYGECLVQSSRLGEAIEVLSKGLNSESQFGRYCRETFDELVVPAVEKKIIESKSVENAFQLLTCMESVPSTNSMQRATRAFLRFASEVYRRRDYQKAVEAYECILHSAEKHSWLDFEDLIRAGDSYVKCGQLNKAWKIYETAKEYSDTFHQTCRLHKKIADLLVIRNQDWHAILHFLVALKSVPSDKGARTKLQKVLKKLGLEHHTNTFLQLNAKYPDQKQLEMSLMSLRKQLKAG